MDLVVLFNLLHIQVSGPGQFDLVFCKRVYRTLYMFLMPEQDKCNYL